MRARSALGAEEQYGGAKGAEWSGVWGGVSKRIIGTLFGHRTLLVDRIMRFLTFKKIRLLVNGGGTSISCGACPLGYGPGPC